jgi:pimeloyl-ACP methyl ester carboxylesterase
LLLHGDADGVNPPSSSLGKEKFFRGVYQRVLIADAGHFPQREKPTEVLASLLRFFSQTSQTQA